MGLYHVYVILIAMQGNTNIFNNYDVFIDTNEDPGEVAKMIVIRNYLKKFPNYMIKKVKVASVNTQETYKKYTDLSENDCVANNDSVITLN